VIPGCSPTPPARSTPTGLPWRASAHSCARTCRRWQFLVKSCLCTLTPDRDLVIDRLPDHPIIKVLLGSAHA
jgi:hypothetical protein